MDTKPPKPRAPIPVSVTTYRVKQVDEKEARRILGRDLEEAMRKGKPR